MPGRNFDFVALGLNVADRETGPAGLDAQRGDHPVAGENGATILHEGREGRIGYGAKEGALDLGGDPALDRQVPEVVFLADRRIQQNLAALWDNDDEATTQTADAALDR